MTTKFPSTSLETTDLADKEISDQLVSARLNTSPLSQFPGTLPESLPKAYNIQSLSIEIWPDQIAGWKVGGIPAGIRAKYHADRLAGPIFSGTVTPVNSESVTTMPVFEGGFAAIEAEIIFETGTTIFPTDSLDTNKALIKAINTAYVGAEIASSPLSKINDIGPPAIISDFGNNYGLIIGEEIPQWLERLDKPLHVRTMIEGSCVGETMIPLPPNGPLKAFQFLIDLCRKRNITLPKGTLVSTGAITGVHSMKIGEIARLEFEGFKPIEATFVAAKPHS